jgi:hypothetical protein
LALLEQERGFASYCMVMMQRRVPEARATIALSGR